VFYFSDYSDNEYAAYIGMVVVKPKVKVHELIYDYENMRFHTGKID
jgi:hypothetical protein